MNRKRILFLIAAVVPCVSFGQTSVSSLIASNLFEPYAVAANPDESYLFVTDSAHHRIVRYEMFSGTMANLAGMPGASGTNSGIGTSARFYQPLGITWSPTRNGVVVADSANQLIRLVTTNGVVTNLAGSAGRTGAADGLGPDARFRFPAGLGLDPATGDIYIADTKNNAIRRLDTNNVVTTVALGFYEPAAVTVGANGVIWVADTRRHVIQRIDTNGVVTLVAGIPNVNGHLDATLADEAQFNSPRGLLWKGGNDGLLISDSGNHVIRRLFFDASLGVYSVETVAGMVGTAGMANGLALSAQFNSPVGLYADLATSGYFVADRANHQVRRVSMGPPRPPVPAPRVGVLQKVVNSDGDIIVSFLPVGPGGVEFNNPVYFVVYNTEAEPISRYETFPHPANLYDPVPIPTESSPQPPSGVASVVGTYWVEDRVRAVSMEAPDPNFGGDSDVTAISTQPGRQSSPVARARFRFRVGSISVVGKNASWFRVSCETTNVTFEYTTDGSDFTNAASIKLLTVGKDGYASFDMGDRDEVDLKVRARRLMFVDSPITTRKFYAVDNRPDRIGFGFDWVDTEPSKTNEGSTLFLACAGQRYYAPVTLDLVSSVSMYSLQFNLTVTNLDGAPSVDGKTGGFEPMLMTPILTEPRFYTNIPPAMVVVPGLFPVLTNLLFTNASANLVGVGWVERYGTDGLFVNTFQNLISFSRAWNTVFRRAGGRIMVGGYSFKVPAGASLGDGYKIQLDRVSATSDGVAASVDIKYHPNATNLVTVASRGYIVGDVEPFSWLNAGEFGGGTLDNSDVLQVFEAAIYPFYFTPAPESDFEDALDSCCGGLGDPSVLFNGNDQAINDVVYGDGKLDVADVFVTFRRSLDPSLTWVKRYWTNGVRQFVKVPNVHPSQGGRAAAKSAGADDVAPLPGEPFASFTVDDVVAGANRTVQVPIRVRVSGGLPVRVALLGLKVTPLDGAPALTDNVQFQAAPGFGSASFVSAESPGRFAAAWLDNTVAGVGGTNLFGLLTVTLPENAPPEASYRVSFDHLSASPNGLGVFPQSVTEGLVTLSDRSGSSWNDGIPDLWRLKHFGSLSNLLSAASADADGDGVPNWAECKAGTNPNDVRSKLQLLNTAAAGHAGIQLRWPTALNRRYVLEGTTSLGSGNWQTVATDLVGDGMVREFIDTNIVAGPRFYRVRVQE